MGKFKNGEAEDGKIDLIDLRDGPFGGILRNKLVDWSERIDDFLELWILVGLGSETVRKELLD